MSRDVNWLWALAALALLGGGGVAVYDMTRGLRNNNPGNIKYDGTAWEGLADPPTDGTFAIFTSPEYGIRAMARILTNYVEVDGVAPTVDALIRRWSNTDQDAYVNDVSQWLGVNPNQALDLASILPSLVAAITNQENGLQPYSDVTIAQGIALA